MDPPGDLTKCEGTFIVPRESKPGRFRWIYSVAWLRSKEVPFLDDEIVDDDWPSLSLSDFQTPRLRRCSLDPATIGWDEAERVGGGFDGHCWKVHFGNAGPFVVKVFYEKKHRHNWYLACQRESHNATLFRMIQKSVARRPVVLNSAPTTLDHALSNLYAFSDGRGEDRVQHDGQDAPSTLTLTSESVPRLRQCYGWMKVHGRTLFGLPARLRAPRRMVDETWRVFEEEEEYFALVYEYIEEEENELETARRVAAFFHLTGFQFQYHYPEDWKHSVLIDLSGIVRAGDYNWSPFNYGRGCAKLFPQSIRVDDSWKRAAVPPL